MHVRRHACWSLAIVVTLTIVHGRDAPAKPPARIIAEAGKSVRIDTPVSVRLKGIPDLPPAGKFRLEEIRGSKRLPTPSQVQPGDSPRLWWILAGTTPAGGKRVYELAKGKPPPAAGVAVRQGAKALEISCAGGKVLRYNHAPVPPPKGADPLYTRSGFIHPLWSPAGEVLTGIHPRDHYHHLGLWHPWTATKFEGRKVDFWNLAKGQGTVRFVKFAAKTSGPVFGAFSAVQEHVNLKAPQAEKVALNETFDVRVWSPGGRDKRYWLGDFTMTQRCASSSPLTLLKYRYGGFGFRATTEWKQGEPHYLTSEGKTRKDGHATRSRWCNVFGPTAKGPAGVLFMSHPQNREHPEPMRIWPKGEVFFNYCPIQKAEWTLKPGNDYVLRYRLCVYEGAITPKAAERLWQDFAHPPEAKVVKNRK